MLLGCALPLKRLTLWCLVFTKRSHILEHACSWKWTTGTKGLIKKKKNQTLEKVRKGYNTTSAKFILDCSYYRVNAHLPEASLLPRKFYVRKNKIKVYFMAAGRTVTAHLLLWSDQESRSTSRFSLFWLLDHER